MSGVIFLPVISFFSGLYFIYFHHYFVVLGNIVHFGFFFAVNFFIFGFYFAYYAQNDSKIDSRNQNGSATAAYQGQRLPRNQSKSGT